MIAIIGLGNVLMGDDGVGYHIAKILMEKPPPNTEVIDAGTSLVKIIPSLSDYNVIIFIDAVDFGGNPGEICLIEPGKEKINSERAISLHEINLNSLVQMKGMLGIKAKIIIVGIQPARTNTLTLELSDEVKKAIPKAIRIINEMVAKFLARHDSG